MVPDWVVCRMPVGWINSVVDSALSAAKGRVPTEQGRPVRHATCPLDGDPRKWLRADNHFQLIPLIQLISACSSGIRGVLARIGRRAASLPCRTSDLTMTSSRYCWGCGCDIDNACTRKLGSTAGVSHREQKKGIEDQKIFDPQQNLTYRNFDLTADDSAAP